MRSRTWLFSITLIIGLTLVVLGSALVAPIGSPSGPGISNPQVVGAPLMFVAGIVLLFFSVVVYEVYPSREDDDQRR